MFGARHKESQDLGKSGLPFQLIQTKVSNRSERDEKVEYAYLEWFFRGGAFSLEKQRVEELGIEDERVEELQFKGILIDFLSEA